LFCIKYYWSEQIKEQEGAGCVESYAKYYKMKLPGRPEVVVILNEI
jgi:hypothetical protein